MTPNSATQPTGAFPAFGKRGEAPARFDKIDIQMLILDSIPSIVVLVDAEARIVEWNRSAQQVFGIDAKRAVGQKLNQLPIEWNAGALIDRVKTVIRAGKAQRLEQADYRLASGVKGILGFTLIPLNGAHNEVLGCILLGAEITDRKRLESQLAQAQKMESIGQLAAGIAHEINTPTQYIGDNLRFLKDAFADLTQLSQAYDELLRKAGDAATWQRSVQQFAELKQRIDLDYLNAEVPQALTQSLEGVEQVSRIVRAMKQFSHPDSLEMTAANLNAAIENTVTVTRNEWKYLADTVLDLDPDLPPVPCLLGQFNQVILNIIVNATHAIADKLQGVSGRKGKITISTRTVGQFAEIRVADTGLGIPKAVQPRIFDLFFTTKEVGKGTGQGLAIAYSVIVEKHKGSITFETKEGEGTTFIIRLPLVASEVEDD